MAAPRTQNLWALILTSVTCDLDSSQCAGLRSVQRTFCFLFVTANGLRAERSLLTKRSRVTNIFQFFHYRPYSVLLRYEKDPVGAAIFFRYSKHSNLSLSEQSFSRPNAANIQQNVRCVYCTERTPSLLARCINFAGSKLEVGTFEFVCWRVFSMPRKINGVKNKHLTCACTT